MKKLILALLLTGLTLTAFAADNKAVLDAREKNFKNLKKQMETIKDALGKPNQKEVLATAGSEIVKSAKAIPGNFPVSSKDEMGREAKPSIWANFADFQKKADALAMSGDAFVKAANAGDTAKAGDLFKQMAGDCKACHNEYRE